MGILDGRVAVVTGSSRGIGAATAQRLDAAGARIVLVARDQTRLSEVARTLTNPSVVIAADLSDSDLSGLVSSILGKVERVDVLVNNAGANLRMPSTGVDAAMFDYVYAVNVRGAFLLTAGILPVMVHQGGGAIVNVSSISGVVGTPMRAAYAATKGAICAMTRSLAMEFGPSGIRVNAVAPGVIDTEMWAENKAIPGVPELVNSQIALRRWGLADDVADVIAFLASDAARYVTAQTISIDGGQAHTLDLFAGVT